MDRYLLFGGEEFHPLGGMSDFIKESNSIDDLIEIATKIIIDDNCLGVCASYPCCVWWHIYDIKTNKIVATSEHTAGNGNAIVYELVEDCDNCEWVKQPYSKDGIVLIVVKTQATQEEVESMTPSQFLQALDDIERRSKRETQVVLDSCPIQPLVYLEPYSI
jgi:hypothetical protein